MKITIPILALAMSALAVSAQTTTVQWQSGGTAAFPTMVGSTITISDMTLADGHLATFTCPVLLFGAGTYQWNWTCGNGNVTTSDGVVSPVLGGKVALNCVGGGRGRTTTCTWTGSGEFSDPSGSIGAWTFRVTGLSNNRPTKVLSFYASWTGDGSVAPQQIGGGIKPSFVNPACWPNVNYYSQWRVEYANGWMGPAFYWGWQYYDSCTNQAINWFVPLVLFG